MSLRQFKRWLEALREAAARETKTHEASDDQLNPKTLAFALNLARVVDERGLDVEELRSML